MGRERHANAQQPPACVPQAAARLCQPLTAALAAARSCDVDSADNCPAGTDLADCGGADSPALQAARQRFYPNRTMLDDGAPRPISAVSSKKTHDLP